MTQINQNVGLSFLERKILNEKRKRYQTYLKLNFILSLNTCFDFFTLDAFKIFKNIIRLSQSSSSNDVKRELILLPFLEVVQNFELLLAESRITEPLNKLKIFARQSDSFFLRLKKSFAFLHKTEVGVLNQFSYDLTKILQKTVENALYRFKSPVITSEILFVTLLEQGEVQMPLIFKSSTLNNAEGHVLHYNVLKQIHKQESSVRNLVQKKDQYFAYLLKTQLSEMQFNRLIEEGLLPYSVSFFRSNLLKRIGRMNLSKILEQNIYNSVKNSRHRKYSA